MVTADTVRRSGRERSRTRMGRISRYDLPEVSSSDEGRQAKPPQAAEVDLSEMRAGHISATTSGPSLPTNFTLEDVDAPDRGDIDHELS